MPGKRYLQIILNSDRKNNDNIEIFQNKDAVIN